MHRTTYDDGETYVWEANLVPGSIQTDNGSLIRLNGSTTVAITGLSTLEESAMHTLTVDVEPYPNDATKIDASTGNISDNKDYYVEGKLSSAISITGGSPDIYLYNAEVSSDSGPAISITGGASPTIHVQGENTVENTQRYSDGGAGIYVAEGSSVTITGSSRDDVLTARAGADGAGIGGYGENNVDYKPCGDITINHVTVYAYGDSFMTSSPGIGSYESCGAIRISDATVHAIGLTDCPAIGSRYSVPDITISRSVIHAHRGIFSEGTSYADWIGRGGSINDPHGAIQGTLTNTTVYKYMWNNMNGHSVSEGTVVYDADGVGTEVL